ncbi:MAG: Zn-dependent oligopeptidase [Myxococcales bacterium]|nr:Zn-dependent oligopeptidase [Myxococcales bacterium]
MSRLALLAATPLAALLAACGATPPPAPALPPLPAGPVATAEAGPPAAWASAAAMGETCDAALNAAESIRARIKDAVTPRTIDGTLALFDQMSLALDTTNGLTGITSQMSPDAAVRDAGDACEKRIQKFYSDVGLDRGLYEAVAAVALDGAAPLDRRFGERLLRDFRRSGVDKDEATRTRLAALNAEMVQLSQDYSKNLREDVRFIELADATALKGLPDDYIKAHAPGEGGKIRITTDYPDFFPFETYAEDAGQRAALYLAFENRGYPANKQVMADLLARRAEYVGLLGYPTWAAYQAEDKMVKTAERVDAFIQEVAAAVRPRAEADLKELLVRKRKDDPKAERIEVWDRFYYAAKVREEQYAFDGRQVRPYFSYPKVKQGIFDLYGELFGLRFEPVKDAAVWHASVEAYTLYKGDQRVGRFYLDMHPRDGKYKHAAMFPLQVGLSSGRVPMATLVCNFPDPKDGDALMQHEEVTTFFHEFGHLIHHLLANRSRWSSQAGMGVEWDFVETPSQLLEEWAWSAPVLQRFAKHAETGEPIPADLVQRMKTADEFGKGVAVMRQVFYAAYSFYVHHRDPKTLDLDAYSDEIYGKYSPYPRVPDSHVYASFEHLVGYSSSYYTYQWSLVMAKDLFTRFEANLLDPAPMQRYRDIILEQGATKDASQLVEEFLGRPYTLDAYRKWLQGGAPKAE